MRRCRGLIVCLMRSGCIPVADQFAFSSARAVHRIKLQAKASRETPSAKRFSHGPMSSQIPQTIACGPKRGR